VAIAGWAVDGHAIGLKMRASGIDVVNLVGEVAEMAAV
jgi:ketol-acid reductoisomerase